MLDLSCQVGSAQQRLSMSKTRLPPDTPNHHSSKSEQLATSCCMRHTTTPSTSSNTLQRLSSCLVPATTFSSPYSFASRLIFLATRLPCRPLLSPASGSMTLFPRCAACTSSGFCSLRILKLRSASQFQMESDAKTRFISSRVRWLVSG